MRFLIAFFVLAGMAYAAPDPVREQRDEWVKKGRWREALTLYQEKLLPNPTPEAAKDWEMAFRCVENLQAWNEFDELFEKAAAIHVNDSKLLGELATSLANVPHGGRFVGGEFERLNQFYGGWSGRRGRGAPQQDGFSCEYRDEVRALQLLRQATLRVNEAERVAIWMRMANALHTQRAHEAWKLQVLTPLDALPAWDASGPDGGTEGAPWLGEGPVLYEIPASWDAAKNDGERWRYALSMVAKDMEVMSIMQRAEFSNSQFGTGTLQGYGWWRQRDEQSAKGLLETETLADDECLAKTSDGVRRFRLPPEHHFIALYRRIMDREPNAGDALVQVYINRRQYDKAVDVLRQVIAKHGEGHEKSRKKLLEQLTGNWGRFDATKTVAAGSKPKLELLFRNAKKVSLSAAPVDMDRVLRDIRSHLESNPSEIDYRRTQPEQIGQRLIGKDPEKYIGAVAKTWQATLIPDEKHRETRAMIEMPLDQAGAWWVKANIGDGNEFYTLVWIVDGVLVQRNIGGSTQWWLADAKSGAAVPDAKIEFFGYRTEYIERKLPTGRRYNTLTKAIDQTTDAEGKVLADLTDQNNYQWLAVARKAGRAPVFYGFQNFYRYDRDGSPGSHAASYGVTDRPLYRPGDTAHFKFWLREVGYGEVDEKRWAAKQGTLVLSNGRGQEVVKIENLTTNELGAIEASAVIPKDAVLGNWYARFLISHQHSALVHFTVEEYRKPEYEVKVEAPDEPIRLGDKFTATVKAHYFHGAPVRQASVEITVKRQSMTEPWFPAWRWDWLYGRGAWWCGTISAWHPTWQRWGCIPPAPPWYRDQRHTPDELVLKKTVPIDADGTAKVEIDSAPAREIHGDMDARYTIEAKVTDASRREETANGAVVAARKPFEVVVWTDRGHARPNEAIEATVSVASLAGKPVANAKGTLKLLGLSFDPSGKLNETGIESWDMVTDADGKLTRKFQAPKAGQYRLVAQLALQEGEAVESAVILSVFGDAKAGNGWRFGPLELVPDKTSYAVGDRVKLRVNSDQENAQVWLFIRGGKDQREQRLLLDGKSREIEIPLAREDQPNFFIEGVTVFDAEVHDAVRQILLPPESRALEVTLEPAKEKVKPREKSALAVTIRDADGKPFHGSATLTVYDKSLEAITGGSNVSPILQNFWSWNRGFYRYSRNDGVPASPGNLVRENAVAMQSWDREVMALGLSGKHKGLGYELGGGVGQLSELRSRSVAFMPAAAPIAKEDAAPADAFAAGGTAEGDAGGGQSILVRKDFADLLKWQGEVKTDENGRAEIPLEFPDNLTTWKARVWALGSGTRVGEGSAEIITSKELLVRLEAPRFLVEKDEAVFSAVVHNDHDIAKTVDVSLELSGGALEAIDGKSSKVEIAAKGEARVDWRVKAIKEGEATIRMKADAGDDGDAMERKIPVLVHGMLRQDAWSRVVEPDQTGAKIEIDVPEKRRAEQSVLTVRYSPSVAGAIVDAIPYLVDYPYGCTEQTLNRFVPAVVAQKFVKDLGLNLAQIRNKRSNLNPQELGDAKERAAQWQRWQRNPVFDEAELGSMVRVGVEKLTSMRNSDGGWGWFSGYGEQSYPHTTAVVVHGLLVAKANGGDVPQQLITGGVAWLENAEKREVAALQRYVEHQKADAEKREWKSKKPEKSKADATDAFVRMVLGEAGKDGKAMQQFLVRDRLDLPVYAQCLLGLELHRVRDTKNRDDVMATIAQFVKRDEENQTNYLALKNERYWWYWYGSDVEAHSWYLKLLAAVKPQAQETRGLVKYLVNNRKHASYWNSTRDTAYAIEALAAYLKASGETAPEMTINVVIDGKSLKQVKIDKENLFSFDGTLTLRGDEVTSGKHTIELKRSGKGALYANAYLEVFSLEDFLRKAGLEVKVERRMWKLTPVAETQQVPDKTGLVVNQQGERFLRSALNDGDGVKSGERVEVELILTSKNDYEYLIFVDAKAAGFEAVEALSGYTRDRLMAYMEPRDQMVNFFIRQLPRGTHTLRYELRAEAPGSYHALPAKAEAMYAPELRANSDEFRVKVD